MLSATAAAEAVDSSSSGGAEQGVVPGGGSSSPGGGSGMSSIVSQLTAIQAADRWLAQGNATPTSELLDKLATPKRVKSPPTEPKPSPIPTRKHDESAGAIFDR